MQVHRARQHVWVLGEKSFCGTEPSSSHGFFWCFLSRTTNEEMRRDLFSVSPGFFLAEMHTQCTERATGEIGGRGMALLLSGRTLTVKPAFALALKASR